MSLLTSCGSHDLVSASALCVCPQRITVLVGKPFSLKELVEALRAENKSQVRTGGAVLTDRGQRSHRRRRNSASVDALIFFMKSLKVQSVTFCI